MEDLKLPRKEYARLNYSCVSESVEKDLLTRRSVRTDCTSATIGKLLSMAISVTRFCLGTYELISGFYLNPFDVKSGNILVNVLHAPPF